MRLALDYASSIWSPLTSSTSINKQQVMQNAALTTVPGFTQDIHIQHLHDVTLILPIHEYLQLHAPQYKQKTQHPSHPLHKHKIYCNTPRQKKPTIFNNDCYTKNLPIDPYTITTTDIKTNMRHIHTLPLASSQVPTTPACTWWNRPVEDPSIWQIGVYSSIQDQRQVRPRVFGVESVMRVKAASLHTRASTASTSGTLNDLTTDLIMANNNKHLATRGNNKILHTPPPHISSSEEIHPRLTRRTLAQLRTNKAPFLKSYLLKADA